VCTERSTTATHSSTLSGKDSRAGGGVGAWSSTDGGTGESAAEASPSARLVESATSTAAGATADIGALSQKRSVRAHCKQQRS
jgi:hypothetical protein